MKSGRTGISGRGTCPRVSRSLQTQTPKHGEENPCDWRQLRHRPCPLHPGTRLPLRSVSPCRSIVFCRSLSWFWASTSDEGVCGRWGQPRSFQGNVSAVAAHLGSFQNSGAAPPCPCDPSLCTYPPLPCKQKHASRRSPEDGVLCRSLRSALRACQGFLASQPAHRVESWSPAETPASATPSAARQVLALSQSINLVGPGSFPLHS